METRMLDVENHKGQPCVVKPLLCQEGFCSECFIYLEKTPLMKKPRAKIIKIPALSGKT